MSDSARCDACSSQEGIQRYAVTVDGVPLNVSPLLCKTHGERFLFESGAVLGELLRSARGPVEIERFRSDVRELAAFAKRHRNRYVTLPGHQLLELCEAYTHLHARCESCGFERCKHNQSPACAAFSEE